ERAQHWLKVGAQPSAAVTKLFKLTGDWGKFTGEGSTTSSVEPQKPGFDKKANYEAAVKAAANEPAEGATTAKKKAQDKLAAKSAPAPVAEEAAPAVEESAPAVEEVVAEATEVPAEVVAEEAAPAAEETPAE
ncbi:MAG: 30S ribosomal protein S16, partial [Candidatus Nanopelagicaceae bacterium]